MEQHITIFHGSEKIVEQPVFGAGKRNNDFGLGFYCTASEALARSTARSTSSLVLKLMKIAVTSATAVSRFA